MINHNLNLRALLLDDADSLSELLLKQSDEYIQHFKPFSFSLTSVQNILSQVQQDVYMGIFWDDALVGFFMLRGWDSGYEIPAYGVMVDERYRGAGIGGLTLSAAKTISKLRGASRIMLKVHPANLVAKQLYESAGYKQSGIDEKNQNLIYYLDL